MGTQFSRKSRKAIFIYRERDEKEKEQIKKSVIHWFKPKMPAAPGAEPGSARRLKLNLISCGDSRDPSL